MEFEHTDYPARPCPTCFGGSIVRVSPCDGCDGTGWIKPVRPTDRETAGYDREAASGG